MSAAVNPAADRTPPSCWPSMETVKKLAVPQAGGDVGAVTPVDVAAIMGAT